MEFGERKRICAWSDTLVPLAALDVPVGFRGFSTYACLRDVGSPSAAFFKVPLAFSIPPPPAKCSSVTLDYCKGESHNSLVVLNRAGYEDPTHERRL